jgi:peptide/nickel transport system permease protein
MTTSTTTIQATGAQVLAQEKTSGGQWALAWRRMRRHRLAMIGLVVLTVIVVASLAAQWIAPYTYDEIDLGRAYTSLMAPGEAGRAVHFLGTDGLGRDVFTRLLYAGRVSLGVALSVTILVTIVGVVVGAISGYFGGVIDTVLMRFADIMLTLPDLPLLLILSSSLRQFVALQDALGDLLGVVIIIFVLTLFGWMSDARLVRGQALSLRTREFIDASRSLGASQARIVFTHIVPNALAPIIVSATLGFGGVIIAESALSVLGFGIMPPIPTWGNMLNDARSAPLQYLFVQALSPGFCIFLTVLSINFIGDGLRDALDPRLKM